MNTQSHAAKPSPSVPALHYNPLAANWQLTGWLLFHPSAWRQYLQGVDSKLDPDFALYTIHGEQWRNPALSQLLGIVHLAGPLSIGLFTFLWVWAATQSLQEAIRGGIYTFMLGFSGGLAASTMVSVAFGTLAGTLAALLIGLFFFIEEEYWYDMAIVAGIFAAGIAGKVLTGLASWTHKSKSMTPGQWIVAVLINGMPPVFILAVTFLIAPPFFSFLANESEFFGSLVENKFDAYTASLAFGIFVILRWYLRSWLWAAAIALVFAICIKTFMHTGTDVAADDNLIAILMLRPVIGGLSNGLLFAILFALPYLMMRHMLTNVTAGVWAGLLSSGGIYILLSLLKGGDSFLLLWGAIAAGAGFMGAGSRTITGKFFPAGMVHKAGKIIQNLKLRHVMENITQVAALQAKEASKLTVAAVSTTGIINPYTGRPLTEEKDREIFVGREDIVEKIKQHLDNPRTTPLLIYGQRRIGKTSLLYQLNQFLPERYLPLYVNLQKVISTIGMAKGEADFIYLLYRNMQRSANKYKKANLPLRVREDYEKSPLLVFDEWLDEVEAATSDHTLVLNLDEFEALDEAFKDKRLNQQKILSYLRDMFQHRSRFKIILAGFYLVKEFPEWGRYLNNVIDLNLGCLGENDACRLIEEPYPAFPLRYRPDALRHLLYLTHCHPAMLQLLCLEIVNLVKRKENELVGQDPRLVTVKDVESAVACTNYLHFFGHMITVSENEKDLLRFIADHGPGVTVPEKTVYEKFLREAPENPLRQGTLEYASGGYRFSLEPIRRYFIKR